MAMLYPQLSEHFQSRLKDAEEKYLEKSVTEVSLLT